MANVMYGPDGSGLYLRLVGDVRRYGDHRTAYGEKVRDLGFTVMEIANPHRVTPLGTGRGLSRNIIAAQAVQLVGAFSDPHLTPMHDVDRKERDGRLWAAYGDRMGYQILDVVHKLRTASRSREAVVSLWNPSLDNAEYRQEHPQTLALHFHTDDAGALVLDVFSRSADVWNSLPYEWAQFSVLHRTVAVLAGLEAGVFRHTSGTTYLRENDVAKVVENLHGEPEDITDESFPPGLARSGDTAHDTVRRCRRLPYSAEPYVAAEHWYRDAILRRILHA